MTPALLSARLRSDDPSERGPALKHVERALRRAGSVRGAAALLGVSTRTIEGWALRGYQREIPEVADLVDRLGLRREQRQASGSGAGRKNREST